jgi:hypothetical protein
VAKSDVWYLNGACAPTDGCRPVYNLPDDGLSTAQADPFETFMFAPAAGRVAQEAAIRVRLLVMLTTGSRQFASSAFASMRSGVSKPSVNQL